MAVQSRALPISGRLGRLGNHRQLLLNIAVVALCSVGVKIAGMLRDVVLASEFGTSDAADAFIAAWAIPQFLAIIVGNAFAGVIIPLQAEAHGQGGERHSRRFLSEMLLISIAGLIVVTLAMIPLRDTFLPLVTSNFGPAKLAQTRELWMIMLPAIFLFAMSTIWSAMLNTGDRFGLAAMSPVLVPVATIGALWIYPQGGITSPTVGFVLGSFAQVVFLVIGLHRHELDIVPSWHGGLRRDADGPPPIRALPRERHRLRRGRRRRSGDGRDARPGQPRHPQLWQQAGPAGPRDRLGRAGHGRLPALLPAGRRAGVGPPAISRSRATWRWCCSRPSR